MGAWCKGTVIKKDKMKNIAGKAGKLILGILLFVAGLGLFYAGCKYNMSHVSGFIKKFDTLVYIICFVPSLAGLAMVADVFSRKKETHDQENGKSDILQ
jgi:hypothetical protein